MKERDGNYRNIKYGMILSYVSMFISVLGNIFLANKILYYVGDYYYGLYGFANSIVTWLAVFPSAITASYLRFMTIENESKDGDIGITNSVFARILFILGMTFLFAGSILFIFLFFSNKPFLKYELKDSRIIYLLLWISIINIGVSIPITIYSLYINYKRKFVLDRVVVIIRNILFFIGNFLIAFYTRNIVVIALWSIVITIFTWIINAYFCKTKLDIRFYKMKLTENRELFLSILSFSSILLFNSIVDQINNNVDKTLLGVFSIPEDVTIYQLGQQFSTYLIMMSISVSNVFAPSIHEKCVKNDKKGIDLLFLKISRVQSIVIVMVVFGFMACGRDFVIWWIGENRIQAFYIALALMMIDVCPLTMNSSIEIQRAYNKHKFRAYTYLLVAIINMILSISFLIGFSSGYKVYACLLGTIIARICSHWILMNIYNDKVMKLPVKEYFLVLLKYICVGTVCVAIVCMIQSCYIYEITSPLLRFIIEGVEFILIYSVFLLLFDRTFLKTIIKIEQ